MRVVTLKVGGKDWALSVAYLREVVHLSQLTAPPTSSQFLEGFLDLAGEHIPIIRLAALLGLKPAPDSLYTPVLILKGNPLGLLVDGVGDLVEVPSESLRSVPPERVLNDFVESEFAYQERLVYLIDPQKLLLQEEKLRMRELHDEHCRRIARLKPTS